MKRKIVTIVGARPQFIKMASVSPLLRNKFNEIIVHTGQHFDKEMSHAFFSELRIPKPDYNLGINSINGKEQIARMIARLGKVLTRQSPDLVIVYGDTNSTLAGALAAQKFKISVAHIEAGLRSFNCAMPEETNRIIVDHISSFLFCPTKISVSNLKEEGVNRGIFLVGDVMCDSIRHYFPIARRKSKIISKLKLKSKKYYLLTIHRVENTKKLTSLRKILSYVDNLDYPTIFPIHPRTRKFLGRSFKAKKGLTIIPPIPYLDMLVLEKNSRVLFTDSGGMQKEAYILKVPCMTLRKETEWVETLQGGCNRIIDFQKDNFPGICSKVAKSNMSFKSDLYGNGNTAKKIIRILEQNVRQGHKIG